MSNSLNLNATISSSLRHRRISHSIWVKLCMQTVVPTVATFIQPRFSHLSLQASDGLYTTLCNVNITIRDVNNHAPLFSREHYLTSIEENFPIGKLNIVINNNDRTNEPGSSQRFSETRTQTPNNVDGDDDDDEDNDNDDGRSEVTLPPPGHVANSILIVQQSYKSWAAAEGPGNSGR